MSGSPLKKKKGDVQLGIQKTELIKVEGELDSLIKAQQDDVAALNAENTLTKKTYIDAGLKMETERLKRAQDLETKEKAEYDRSTKERKSLEAKVADLNQQLLSAGGASNSSQSAASPTTAPTSTPT